MQREEEARNHGHLVADMVGLRSGSDVSSIFE